MNFLRETREIGRPVSQKRDSFNKETGFFFFCAQFHLKLDNKNGSFCDHFWQKVEFLGSFMKPWFGINVETVSLAGKIETGGRGEAACRQFQFFPAKLTVSTFYANITVSWKCPKISTFCQKLVTKLAIFICQFQVKLWHNKIKKWTRFFLETGLLANFYAKAPPLYYL